MPFSNPKFAHFNDELLQLSRSPILDSGDLKETVKLILEAGARCLEVERLSVWLYNAEKTKITCMDLYENSSSTHTCSKGLEITAEEYPVYFEALGYHRVLAIKDVKTDRRTAELLQSYLLPRSIVSMLDAPIREYGEIVGVVCSESVSQTRRWDSHEIYFAGILSDLIARALLAKKRKDGQDALLQKITNLEKQLSTKNS